MKSRSKIWRESLEFLGFRLTAALAGALPLDVASGVSGHGWRLVAPFLKRHQRALDNLAIAFPDMSLGERNRIALAMWENLGRTFAEFFHIRRLRAEERVTAESPEALRALARGAPCVICGMHMGNWELLGHLAAQEGLSISGTYQSLTNPLVDKWIFDRRAPMYTGGLFEKSHATARALIRLTKTGVCPAFLADLREGRGVRVPFFGREAWSNPFPALIARTQGIPLYAARLRRLPGSRFTMRIEPVEVPRTDDRDADVRAATANLQARFEEFVRADPEQWMWAHRRWD